MHNQPIILELTARELHWLDDLCLHLADRCDDDAPAHTLQPKINAIKFPIVPCGPAKTGGQDRD